MSGRDVEGALTPFGIADLLGPLQQLFGTLSVGGSLIGFVAQCCSTALALCCPP
jgi:hypothetical protein